MVSEAEIDAALQEERLRQHQQVLAGSMLSSAGMAAVLATALWPVATRGPLLAWLAALALAIAFRLAASRVQRQHWGLPAAWLLAHRLAFVLHGLVWAAVSLLPGAGLGGRELDLMVFALVAMAAGSLGNTSFDLRAALGFVLPVLAGAVAASLRTPDLVALALLAAALVFVVFAVGAARRQQAAVRIGVRLRLTQARQAAEARDNSQRADSAHQRLADQHELLAQLLQSTQQGYWFIDNEGRTTDVNPAMARLLGRPREALLGRNALELVDAEDVPQLQHELEQRRLGQAGRYEAGLHQPDGSRLYGACTATPLHDASGARIGSVGVWTDITARRRAEAELRCYELAVNSITDVVSVVGRDECYLLVNDAWCRAARVTREQALGRRIGEVLAQRVTDERLQALRDCLSSGQIGRSRGPDTGARREGCVVETSYFPHLDDHGRVQEVVLVSRDITEQEQQRAALMTSEAEQRALLDNFPGYISRMSRLGVYTYVNRRLAGLLGLRPEEMVGRGLPEVVGEARAAALRPLIERALAGEAVSYEHRVTPSDGDEAIDLQVRMVAAADPLSGEPVIYGFTLDVSARKRAEEALISARDEAQRASRAKSQFLSQMSHELRTPLNAVLGFGQLLASDPRAALAPHQQAWVNEMQRGAEHLLSLINEILDLGRIEAGGLPQELQPMSPAALVADCLALVQALAQRHGVRLQAVTPGLETVRVVADARRLKQVLLNLLGNAIKYNRRGGEVAVLWRHEGPQLWLAVRDTGPGLNPDEQERLFQPFERLGAATSGIEGTGIGLALSRRLVEAMGGQIGVHSQPGQGSTFWLLLPLETTPLAPPERTPAPPAPVVPAAPAAAQRPVLYIEDNPVNVVLMEAMLARLPGLRLLCAGTPGEGLRLAETDPPALVLLDIHLPEMDGFAVLQRLRALPGTAHTPVVAVSANALPHDIDTALAAGFAAYLTKPLSLDSLLATVRAMLAQG